MLFFQEVLRPQLLIIFRYWPGNWSRCECRPHARAVTVQCAPPAAGVSVQSRSNHRLDRFRWFFFSHRPTNKQNPKTTPETERIWIRGWLRWSSFSSCRFWRSSRALFIISFSTIIELFTKKKKKNLFFFFVRAPPTFLPLSLFIIRERKCCIRPPETTKNFFFFFLSARYKNSVCVVYRLSVSRRNGEEKCQPSTTQWW